MIGIIKTVEKKVKWIFDNHPLMIIFILYLIANSFFLVNDFLYWDDWCWTGNKVSDYIYINKLLGMLPCRGLLYIFAYMLPPLLVRIAEFSLFGFSAFFIYKILSFIGVSKENVFWITALYILNPLIETKYSLCIFAYYFSLFEFSFASYLLICCFEYKVAKISSLVLFFLSFQLNSLLCFYAIPFIFLFYKEFLEDRSKEKFVDFVKKYVFFLILPFVFFCIKHFFLKPMGAYAEEGYNSIRLSSILKSITLSLEEFSDVFSYSFLNIQFSGFILILLFTYFVYNVIRNKKIDLFLIFSLLSFFFAVFPYAAVGKRGISNSFTESRHYFLVLFPIALFILYFVKKIIKPYKIVFVCIVLSFINTNVHLGYKFIKDKMICQSFIENVKNDEIIKNTSLFAYHEENEYGYSAKDFNNYVLTGLMWKAFGNENHAAYNETLDPNRSNFNRSFETRHDVDYTGFWKIRDAKEEEIKWRINFKVNDFRKKDVAKTLFLNFFNKEKYCELVKEFSKVWCDEL